VWRNAGSGDATKAAPMGSWLALRLAEDGPNRDAIGAWLEIKVGDLTINREVTIGGGHAGGQLGWIHVGLGRANQAQVRVQWPDGEWGPSMEIAADQFATIQRGASAPAIWATPPP
jgi:enediyne biosynthesis protein E4